MKTQSPHIAAPLRHPHGHPYRSPRKLPLPRIRWPRLVPLGLLLAAVVLFSATPVSAAKESSQDASYPALNKFGDAVTFYLSFDHPTPQAEMSEGQATPQETHSRIDQKPGLFGKAFLSGTKRLTFDAKQNADLSGTGSIAVWVRPWQWQKHEGEPTYLSFISIRDHGRLLATNRMGNKVNQQKVQAYVKAGKQLENAVGGFARDWRQDQWHLLVVNWKPASIEFSLDAKPLTRVDAPWLSDADGHSGQIRVGSGGHPGEQFLLDELLILDRPMENQEIDWLYKQGKQTNAGS